MERTPQNPYGKWLSANFFKDLICCSSQHVEQKFPWTQGPITGSFRDTALQNWTFRTLLQRSAGAVDVDVR